MAIDIFLKIDNVPGESNDSAHKDEIELASYCWGVNNPPSAQVPSATGRPSGAPLKFVKTVDKASPQLLKLCCLGAVIPTVVLSIRRAGANQTPGFDFVKITLQGCVVAAIEQLANPGTDLPVEEVALAYQRIKIAYTSQKPNGAPGPMADAGWDFAANAPF
ncbi:MAG: type VI secretion system tube protein Hcp [Myxococcales bacterium]|nr:type VI secretion system tube protein Hcp [Myxococcales bacterium]